MADGYRVARLDEIPKIGETWRPVRHHLGIGAFGVNGWEGDRGAEVIEEHDETGADHEELYVVVRGRARFTLDGENVDAPAGTVLFVRPPVNRVAVAEEAGTTVLAVGAKRGEAFTPSSWELRHVGG
jgi:quercetin dioxygenase-like cupin family protein